MDPLSSVLGFFSLLGIWIFSTARFNMRYRRVAYKIRVSKIFTFNKILLINPHFLCIDIGGGAQFPLSAMALS
jgi:hypothetical protein